MEKGKKERIQKTQRIDWRKENSKRKWGRKKKEEKEESINTMRNTRRHRLYVVALAEFNRYHGQPCISQQSPLKKYTAVITRCHDSKTTQCIDWSFFNTAQPVTFSFILLLPLINIMPRAHKESLWIMN